MNKNVAQILQAQRSFFESQKTKDIKFRIQHLKILKKTIEQTRESYPPALPLQQGHGNH